MAQVRGEAEAAAADACPRFTLCHAACYAHAVTAMHLHNLSTLHTPSGTCSVSAAAARCEGRRRGAESRDCCSMLLLGYCLRTAPFWLCPGVRARRGGAGHTVS